MFLHHQFLPLTKYHVQLVSRARACGRSPSQEGCDRHVRSLEIPLNVDLFWISCALYSSYSDYPKAVQYLQRIGFAASTGKDRLARVNNRGTDIVQYKGQIVSFLTLFRRWIRSLPNPRIPLFETHNLNKVASLHCLRHHHHFRTRATRHLEVEAKLMMATLLVPQTFHLCWLGLGQNSSPQMIENTPGTTTGAGETSLSILNKERARRQGRWYYI